MKTIKIKSPITKRSISQKELAFFVGVTPSYISMILSGDRTPTPKIAKKLSKITGKSLEYWLFNNIKKENQ
jgi:transcriptional regulator with XRE-family HTH domain